MAIIAVDFDGTCVEHAYPAVGADIGAAPVLRALTEAGHQLILWTVRSGDNLKAAEEWFARNNIPLYGVNKNPQQAGWSASPKAHANLFIDDLAFGCPLVRPFDRRAFVDWRAVLWGLYEAGMLPKTVAELAREVGAASDLAKGGPSA